MAPKRARTSATPEPSFDTTKFVSAAAERRCEKGMGQKVPIIERGFEINPGQFPEIDRVIATRHWHKLCQQPHPAYVPVVREFYANAYEHQAYRVMVRGQQVTFDRTTINRFYRLPDIEADEYSAAKDNIDMTHLTETLCIPNAAWEMSSSGEYIKMSSRYLKPDARVWFHFLTRTLLPGTHITNVTKERMILLYCLLEGYTIDIGGLISANIVLAARSTQTSLLYCSLIASLCTRARVPMDPREEMMQPTTALTTRIIQQLRAERHAQAGSSSSAPVPPQQPRPAQRSSRSRSLTQRIARLESRIDFIIQDSLATRQLLQQMAHHLNMRDDQIPEFPDLPEDDSDNEEAEN